MGKLILSIILFIFIGCHSGNIDYQSVYSNDGEVILYEKLNKNLDKKIIERNNDFKLVTFLHKTSVYEYYYYLIQGNNKKLIKAPFNINCKNRDLKWEQLLSCLINIKNFNNYINAFNYKKLDSIQNIFFNLISNGKNFVNLVNQEDINEILKNHALKKKNSTINDLLLINDFSKIKLSPSDSNKENIKICWFPDYGLVKFNFYHKENTLINVESEFLGYLGNEDIPW